MSVTDNDLKVFSTLGHQQKAAALYYYLCEGYNMQDVGEDVLGCAYGTQASQLPSVIMRCYGFSGKNSGSFARMGLGEPAITIEDFVDFVRKYPNGLNNKQILIDYMKELKNRRLTQNHTQSYTQTSYTMDSFDSDWSYGSGQRTSWEPRKRVKQEYISPSRDQNSDIPVSVDGAVLILLLPFCIAILLRWYAMGVIWAVWYRKIFTVLVAFFALGGFGLLLDKWSSSDSGKRAVIVITMIIALIYASSMLSYDYETLNMRAIYGLVSIVCSLIAAKI